MLIARTKPLFAWDCLEDSPSLATLKEFLAAIPDGRLLEMLHQYRGRGRDDYPVHVLWGVLHLRNALRHVSFEATLAVRAHSAFRALSRLLLTVFPSAPLLLFPLPAPGWASAKPRRPPRCLSPFTTQPASVAMFKADRH